MWFIWSYQWTSLQQWQRIYVVRINRAWYICHIMWHYFIKHFFLHCFRIGSPIAQSCMDYRGHMNLSRIWWTEEMFTLALAGTVSLFQMVRLWQSQAALNILTYKSWTKRAGKSQYFQCICNKTWRHMNAIVGIIHQWKEKDFSIRFFYWMKLLWLELTLNCYRL